LGGRKDSNSTKAEIWKRNAGVQSKHWHEVKSFAWEKRGKGKQMCALIGTEKCKTMATKIEGISKWVS
jgi:hypothetical protein